MTVESAPQVRQFNTFQGVFRPTVLTILGAMFYLREGWLVGSLGLLGALAVILFSHVITGSTALSLASIATNTRVKPGGAFAIIANALGLEAGGAIALPLFLAQTASAAMYLYAFSEVWGHLFPSHNPLAVVGLAYLGVGGIAFVSSGLAFRAQAVLLGVVVLALVSAFGGAFTNPTVTPTLLASGGDVSLLQAFAIFFPACTGIMVGVGMSGSLVDPRKSLPRGTLGAWGAAGSVYLLGAFFYATLATPEELVEHRTIIFDRAAVGPVVVFGVLTSTLMAALSSIVAAPRLLQAMGQHQVVPGHRWLAVTTDAGDPRRATGVTLVLGALFLASGSLDAIAPIITSFFLLTYAAINGVVLLEQRLGMISFRPTFPVAPIIPVLGFVGCILALTLTSPGGGLVELTLVAGTYFWLTRRNLDTPWETTRSGITVTLAAAVARRFGLTERSERAWRPDLCVLLRDPSRLASIGPLIDGLTHRSGSAILMGLGPDPGLPDALTAATRRLTRRGVYTRASQLGRDALLTTPPSVLQRLALDSLQSALFPPNLVLVDLRDLRGDQLEALISACTAQGRGLALFMPDEDAPPPHLARSVQVWVSDRSPDWSLGLHVGNLDLPLLVGFLLSTWRSATLELVTTVQDAQQRHAAAAFLTELKDRGRMPAHTHTLVLNEPFLEALAACPSDLTILGLSRRADLDRLYAQHKAKAGSTLFLLDSGRESFLA